MNSLQKRVTRASILCLLFLAVGLPILFQAQHWFDLQIPISTPAKFNGELADMVGYRFLVGGLLVALGGSLTVSAIILLILTLIVWIGKVPLGSRLTFRGWEPARNSDERAISMDRAWAATALGLAGSFPWIFILVGHSVRGLFLSLHIVPYLIALLIATCGLFYGFGIRLCWRRAQHATARAQGPWTFALAVNYGGFLAFLCFIGTVLVLRSRA